MARKKRTDSRGRVLRVGESQNKQGRYCYRWTEPVTGKRGTVYALSLVELREKEQQIQKDIQDGINTNSANMTLNQLFNIYMDGKANIRESTRCNYENDWNISVKQSILGDMKISQIKQIHVKKLYAELSKRNFKGSTIQTCHVLLSSVFQMAVDSDMLRKNPCKGCQKEIKVEPSQRQALTVKEQNILLDFVENSKTYNVYLPMLTFALSTALRIGDDDDKIRLNQRKPSKYKGLSRFGPEKNLQRINKFMKERPTFYKKLIQMKENFRFYLRCFYCITKVVILQFNSEKQDRISS